MVSVTLSANGVANSDPVDENEKDKSDIDEEDGSRPESQQLKVKLLWENSTQCRSTHVLSHYRHLVTHRVLTVTHWLSMVTHPYSLAFLL